MNQKEPILQESHVQNSGRGFFIFSSLVIEKVAIFLIGLLVLLPIIPLLISWLKLDLSLWQHLWQTQLWSLLKNTLLLSLLVGLGAFILGVSLAWIIVIYDFPGRKILQWGLMLPLAIPPYILAFVFLGFSDFGGPLYSLFNTFGISSKLIPDLRHPTGVALVFILSLYPYIYLLMRTALLRRGQSNYESARTLGYTKFSAFWRLVVPMTRPAWIAGLALVLMETLADFGAVAIFNFDTFTTAIYKSWFSLFSLQTAAQLASILLLIVLLALFTERWARGHSRYTQTDAQHQQFRKKLTGFKGFLVQAVAWLVFVIAFILPLVQLVYWAITTTGYGQTIVELLMNTVQLALLATIATLIVAIVAVFAQRVLELKQAFSRKWQLVSEIAAIGYALPGTVLAVGVVLSFNWIESSLNFSSNQWLAGGVFALIFAYVVRFLRIAQGPISSSMAQIKPSIIEASMSLGADKKERLFRVYIPLLRPGVFTAMLLVFVEVMKEMPATLLLRPFGWDTLSVRIYELTSEGEWQLAALPAVMLVTIGVLPVIYLIKKSES